MTRVLESSAWIKTISWYDNKYRVIQGVSGNHLGGTDRSFTKYDFTGRVLSTRSIHRAANQPDYLVEETYTYDHAGRVVKQYHQLGQSIRWTEKQGIEETADKRLKKTTPAGWGNAGAVSEEIIPATTTGG